MAKEKLICQNPNHPFKQKWYWYEPSPNESQAGYLTSKKYCTSCASYLNMLKILLTAAMQPHPTLYGDAMIKTSKAQLKRLIDEI